MANRKILVVLDTHDPSVQGQIKKAKVAFKEDINIPVPPAGKVALYTTPSGPRLKDTQNNIYVPSNRLVTNILLEAILAISE